jgi:hypothetical protein
LNHGDLKRAKVISELRRAFSKPSLSFSQFKNKSEVFRTSSDLEIFYAGNQIDALYAFIPLDSHSTQIWLECKSGRATFKQIEKIVSLGVDAIRKTLEKSRCTIETGLVYEHDDNDSLPLTIDETKFTKELAKYINQQNLYVLLTIWLLAFCGSYFSTVPNKRSILQILQPSGYAPAAVLIFGLLTFCVYRIRKRSRIVVHVEEF